jgi:hypothetical protein
VVKTVVPATKQNDGFIAPLMPPMTMPEIKPVSS